jgi:hypothetical protein
MMRSNGPFYAILFAICYLVTIGAVLAALGKYSEALGVGAAVTGLIGVIRLPTEKSVTVDNTASDPIPVEAK